MAEANGLCPTCSYWAREAGDQLTEHHPACPEYVPPHEQPPARPRPPPLVDGTDFRDGPYRM